MARVHTHRIDVLRVIGFALLLVVLGGPTMWPWYLMWGLSVLAVTTAQRSWVLAGVAAFTMLVVGPSGNPMLGGAAYLVVGIATLAAGVWLARGRRWQVMVSGNAAWTRHTRADRNLPSR